MGNLISLFLLSMLATEPETSNPGEITFLEHSCSTQVQQTPLLMPELGSTSLLGQKRLNLGHKVPDEYCFQSKAEKVLRRKQFLHFPFQKVPGKLPKPRARTSAATLRLCPATAVTKGSWQSSATAAVRPSWAIWGALQMYLLEHTHPGGSCASPCCLHPETKCYWDTTANKELWGSSYHSWFTAAAITTTRLTRLSALTLLSDLCLETFYFDYKL